MQTTWEIATSKLSRKRTATSVSALSIISGQIDLKTALWLPDGCLLRSREILSNIRALSRNSQLVSQVEEMDHILDHGRSEIKLKAPMD